MSSNVDRCLEILNLCSLDEKKKKEVLNILKVLTHDNQGVVNDIAPTMSPKRETAERLDFERFVSYHSSFLADESFLKDVRFQLNSMDLYRPRSQKPKTLWLSHHDNTLFKYPQISSLLDLVNKHCDVKTADFWT